MKIAVVEDEKAFRENLTTFLRRYEKEKENIQFEITEFSDGSDFITFFKPIYDIIFLDIEMPLSNGIEVAKKIRETDTNAVLVFITNMPQYAIKGYEVNALDYILKPLRYESFRFKLDKAMATARKKEQKLFSFFSAGKMYRIDLDSIYYFEVIRHCIVVHTSEEDYEVWHRPISKLEKELESSGFARCSVSYLINLKHVTSIFGDSVGVGGKVLPLSRGKKKEFLAALSSFMG